MQHPADFQARIETDEIGERQRPHRVIEAEPAGGVDVGDRRDAFAQREASFVEHRHQHAVDDEAGGIVGVDDLLA